MKNLEDVKRSLKESVYVKIFLSPTDRKKYGDKEYIPLRRVLFLIINKLGRGYEVRLVTPTKLMEGKIAGVRVLKHQCTHSIKGLDPTMRLDKAFEGDLLRAQEKIAAAAISGSYEEFKFPEKYYIPDNTGELKESPVAIRDSLLRRDEVPFGEYVVSRAYAREAHLLHRMWSREIYGLLVKA